MPEFFIALIVLLALFTVYWIVIFFVFRYAFARNGAKPPKMNVPKQFHDYLKAGREILESTQKEEVTIISGDGLKLVGEVTVGTTDKTIVLFHGYRSGINDFAGAYKVYLRAGCNIVSVYHRAHGKSEGKYITFGVKESEDCVLWAEYASNRFGGEVFLGGISMGASSVLACADKTLPKNVKGLIVDCPFSSPEDIIAEVGRKGFRVPRFIMPIILSSLDFYCKILGKFSMKNSGAIHALKNATVPVIITHGKEDGFVPCSMSRKMKEVCSSPCYLYEVEGADHGLAYLYDEDGCFQLIRSVLKDNSPV